MYPKAFFESWISPRDSSCSKMCLTTRLPWAFEENTKCQLPKTDSQKIMLSCICFNNMNYGKFSSPFHQYFSTITQEKAKNIENKCTIIIKKIYLCYYKLPTRQNFEGKSLRNKQKVFFSLFFGLFGVIWQGFFVRLLQNFYYASVFTGLPNLFITWSWIFYSFGKGTARTDQVFIGKNLDFLKPRY